MEIPEAEDLKGIRIGIPKELNEAEGIEPGVSEAVAKAIKLAEDLGAEVGECRLPRSVDYGLACYYLDRPGGGQLEPRPLRRRPLRLPRGR